MQEKDGEECLNRYSGAFMGKCHCSPMCIMRKFHSSSEKEDQTKYRELNVFVQLMTGEETSLSFVQWTLQLSDFTGMLLHGGLWRV